VTSSQLALKIGDLLITPLPTGPTVIVGPNGSGKTRATRTTAVGTVSPYEAEVTQSVDAFQIDRRYRIEFLNASRWASVGSLDPLSSQNAKYQYQSQRETSKSEYKHPTNDAHPAVHKFAADQVAAHDRYVQDLKRLPPNSPYPPPPTTELDKLQQIWAQILPGRTIEVKDWAALVTSHNGEKESSFHPEDLSDGERMVLSVIAVVLASDSEVLVIDEPELHLHTHLARRLWDILEDLRPEMHFIYITHDVPFAVSRRNPTFVLARPGQSLELAEVDRTLPNEFLTEIVGAATFAFHASRVVFVEGNLSSIDFKFYRAWFDDDKTEVRPVSSCANVIECVRGVNKSQLALGLTAIGLVDFDYNPDPFQPAGVEVLPFHELESVMLHPMVVKVVARTHNLRYDQTRYESRLRRLVSEAEIQRTIVERWRVAIRQDFSRRVNNVGSHPDATLDAVQSAATTLFSPGDSSALRPNDLLAEEERRVRSAIGGAIEGILKYVPGKLLKPALRDELQLEFSTYVDKLCELLNDKPRASGDDDHAAAELEQVISAWLPDRRTSQ
jgi:ABC-type cobalamin/Fe3+-siderophores transport system ATPase subunit